MKFCPECGSSNDPGVRFCGKCGTPMGEVPTPAVKASRSGGSAGNRTGMKALIAAVAVLVIGGLVYVMFFWPMSESEYEDGARDVLKDSAEAFEGVYEALEEFSYAASDEYDSSGEIDGDAVDDLRDAFEEYSEDIKAIDRDVRALRPPAKYRDADLFLRGVASYLSGDALDKIDDLISELEEGMSYDELEEAVEDLGKDLAFYEIWEGLEDELDY